MKVELDRDEVRAALQQHVARLLGGEWVCTNADYELPRRAEFERDTPERSAEQAREALEAQKYRDAVAAEESAAAESKPVEQPA